VTGPHLVQEGGHGLTAAGFGGPWLPRRLGTAEPTDGRCGGGVKGVEKRWWNLCRYIAFPPHTHPSGKWVPPISNISFLSFFR